MTEVIGAKLHFEPVGSFLTLRQRHHTGVVDQQIKPVELGAEGIRERLHRVQARQVKLHQRDLRVRHSLLKLLLRALPFGHVAAGHHDLSALFRQHARGFVADAAVRPGNDSDPACLVGNIICGPLCCHGLSPHSLD